MAYQPFYCSRQTSVKRLTLDQGTLPIQQQQLLQQRRWMPAELMTPAET